MLMRQTMIQGRRRRAFDFFSPTRAVTFNMRNTVKPKTSAKTSKIRMVGSFSLKIFLKQVGDSFWCSCCPSWKETSISLAFGLFCCLMSEVLLAWEKDLSLRFSKSLMVSDRFALPCLSVTSPSVKFVRIQASLRVSKRTVERLTQTSMMINVEKRRQQRLVRWQRESPPPPPPAPIPFLLFPSLLAN